MFVHVLNWEDARGGVMVSMMMAHGAVMGSGNL